MAAVAAGAEGTGDGVDVGVNVAVAVGVAVGDGVDVGVNVAVAVGVDVGLAVGFGLVGLGAGVGRGLGVAVRLPSTIRPHAPAAKHAIAMSRLILRKKGLAVMLGGLVPPEAAERQHRAKKTRSFIDLLRKRPNQVPEIFTSASSKTVDPPSKWLILMIVIAIRLFLFKTSVHVLLNIIERAKSGQLIISEASSGIAPDVWERLGP
jgi:hypothetical protein